MKKILSGLIICLMAVVFISTAAFAEDDSNTYEFNLNVDGENEIHAAPGDTIEVALTLNAGEDNETDSIFAFQDEIYYKDSFFELVEFTDLRDGVETADLSVQGNYNKAYYMNYLSFGDDSAFESGEVVGIAKLKIVAERGRSYLKNLNYIVSNEDGTDSYKCTHVDMAVILTDDCIVTFDYMDGREPLEVTVNFGEKVPKPEEPEREGYRFVKWCTDKDCTEAWDFTNTVEEDMTLYAYWKEANTIDHGEKNYVWIWILGAIVIIVVIILIVLNSKRKTVEFDSCGGNETYAPGRASMFGGVKKPKNPTKEGKIFAGWYTDAAGGDRWDFGRNRAKENITLYAHWLDINKK